MISVQQVGPIAVAELAALGPYEWKQNLCRYGVQRISELQRMDATLLAAVAIASAKKFRS